MSSKILFFFKKYITLDNLSNNNQNIKLKCKNQEIWWKIKDIDFHSRNKDDVEIFLSTRKYNI